MAQVSAQESTRIMAHMNKDHAESLEWYLEFYGKKKGPFVDPQITAFTTPSMKIEYGLPGKRKEWEYKFQPEMKAGEARLRLEHMHQEARKGLGLSSVTVNSFLPYIDLSTFLVILASFTLQVYLFIAPPSTIASYSILASKFATHVLSYTSTPPTPDNVGRAVKALFLVPFIGAHILECVTKLPKIMRKYNMSDDGVKFAWRVATLVAGFGAWGPMVRKAKAEERALEKTK